MTDINNNNKKKKKKSRYYAPSVKNDRRERILYLRQNSRREELWHSIATLMRHHLEMLDILPERWHRTATTIGPAKMPSTIILNHEHLRPNRPSRSDWKIRLNADLSIERWYPILPLWPQSYLMRTSTRDVRHQRRNAGTVLLSSATRRPPKSMRTFTRDVRHHPILVGTYSKRSYGDDSKLTTNSTHPPQPKTINR